MAVTEEVYTSLIRDLLNQNQVVSATLTARITALELNLAVLQEKMLTLDARIGHRLG